MCLIGLCRVELNLVIFASGQQKLQVSAIKNNAGNVTDSVGLFCSLWV